MSRRTCEPLGTCDGDSSILNSLKLTWTVTGAEIALDAEPPRSPFATATTPIAPTAAITAAVSAIIIRTIALPDSFFA